MPASLPASSDVLTLIPARHASSRFPGKPLAVLHGPDGAKSLVRRVWEAAEAAMATLPGGGTVAVATDDDRIRDHCEGFGAHVLMTDPAARNGTERCADALSRHGLSPDLVVNLQGDAPLTPPWFVTALVDAMAADMQAAVATPVLRCDATTYRHFRDDRAAGRVGGTTAAFGAGGRALYFSKEVVPYLPPSREADAFGEVFHHVGLYAYRPDALARYADLPEGRLERLEGLEQLRFLENGLPVLCVEVEARDRVFWEVNNPEDIARVEAVLA